MTVSELTENKWAVLSERGCEATDLTHEEARRLVHKLAGEGRHGLCIVSNEAAHRLSGRLCRRTCPISRKELSDFPLRLGAFA